MPRCVGRSVFSFLEELAAASSKIAMNADLPPPPPEPSNLADNARWFIAFRVLFNCRFYYPIFTVLFLDLGLSIGEFAALNVLWAATIVLCEVPSGALADRLGRRRLVVWASWLMVGEMATLCLMPVGNHDVVLGLFVLNRILSGLAEAAASGADEALTYDSFPEDERAKQWPRVMASLNRWSSIGFMIAAISGSFLYDHTAVNELLARFNGPTLEKAWTMKIPLLLNLATAIGCVFVARRMIEPPASRSGDTSVRATLKQIKDTAHWVWTSKTAFWLIMVGVVLDSVIRVFLTVSSNYYRLIQIEERWFGIISVAAALLGLVTAGIMERMSGRHSARFNFSWLSAMVFVGLLGAAAAVPGIAGIALILPLMIGMRFLHFFLSHYMNAAIASEHRATALSFRGLTMNLAYGVSTLLFAMQTRYLQSASPLETSDLDIFAKALTWWPAWFLGLLAVTVFWIEWRFRSTQGKNA